MITEQIKTEALFLEEYEKLCRKFEMRVDSCGCCGGNWISKSTSKEIDEEICHLRNEDYVEAADRKSDEHAEDPDEDGELSYTGDSEPMTDYQIQVQAEKEHFADFMEGMQDFTSSINLNKRIDESEYD